MTRLTLFLILLFATAITIMPSYADDDEEYERFGFGELEDDDYEEEDDERTKLGTGISDVILYVTIAAIVATLGYTGFRLLRIKKPRLTS